MKILILAAGKGERLYPLTKNTPKPLIDLGDGETLLEKQLKSLSDSKVIDEVIIFDRELSAVEVLDIKNNGIDGAGGGND